MYQLSVIFERVKMKIKIFFLLFVIVLLANLVISSSPPVPEEAVPHVEGDEAVETSSNDEHWNDMDDEAVDVVEEKEEEKHDEHEKEDL